MCFSFLKNFELFMLNIGYEFVKYLHLFFIYFYS